MTHKFSVERAKILDNPERKKILDPYKILDGIGLERDMNIADIGCGTGYFSIPTSKKVERVYALDIQEEMLNILKEKIRREGIGNITPLLSRESSFPLSRKCIDVALMVNVFHEFEDRGAILKETKRILRKGGILIIVDWRKVEMDMGPPLNERLSREEVAGIVKDSGFKVKVIEDAGPCNYMIIAIKSRRRIEISI